jgi:hypothetical protein
LNRKLLARYLVEIAIKISMQLKAKLSSELPQDKIKNIDATQDTGKSYCIYRAHQRGSK